MADNGLTVTGAADIKLKTIHALLQRQVEGGKGIFRRISSRTAVAE
jgi:hypothetical protein